MSETFSPVPGSSQRRVLEKIGWTALIAVTLFVCYFSHLGAIGFVGPDEPRYAWIARDMAETADWVTPRLYGKPWFEKPPLFYWGAAICFKLFGVSEAAARLPSAICALLATLAMAWLAWRLYGAETARWLLLLLPTTVGMIGFSHAAATDMPFSAMLTIAMVCAAVVLRLTPTPEETGGASHAPTGRMAAPTGAVLDTPDVVPTPSAVPAPTGQSQAPVPVDSTPWLALVLFGFFLGLAVLAKGPAAIILCSGAVFFWALFTKRWRDAFRLLHPAAVAAFCATALPWYILCARRNPDFFRVFIIEHNFKRYLTPEFQHIQPFWFYALVLLAALVPWAVLFLWSLISDAMKLYRTRQMDEVHWFLTCWPVFTILFFTISKSKLPGYILPALPPIALLTAQRTKTWIEQPKFGRRPFVFQAVTVILLCPIAIYFDEFVPTTEDLRPAAIVNLFSMLALVGGATAAALAFRRRLDRSTIALVITFVTFLGIGGFALASSDPVVSARQSIEAVLGDVTAEQAAAVTTFKLRRAYKYQVDFYLHRETEEWSPAFPKHSIILTDRRNLRELEALGARCEAYPRHSAAVRVCEDSMGEPILMNRPNGRGQPQ